MKITSATFIKGVTQVPGMLPPKLPHVAFIGRSNVGKSSTINSITKVNDLAETSSFPGKTKEINIFLINEKFYLIDLPGYGFAKVSLEERAKLQALINSYLFNSSYEQSSVVMIIDAVVGPTADDLDMLEALEQHGKNIIVAANKIDKIKASEYHKQMKKIHDKIGRYVVIPYSTKTKKGLGELIDAIAG
jgi:GTP-binding protein